MMASAHLHTCMLCEAVCGLSLEMEDGKVSFLKRELKLDNRRLDKGSHWPL